MTNTYLYTLKKRVEKPLKFIASGIFILSAIVISFMALTNRIQMDSSMEYGKALRTIIYEISSNLQYPIVDVVFVAGIIVFIAIAIKQAKKK